MTQPVTIEARVLAVLGAVTVPMSAAALAAAIPERNAGSVAAAVSALARRGSIRRQHAEDGVLRYVIAPPSRTPEEKAPIARTYKPPVEPSTVRTLTGEGAALAPSQPAGPPAPEIKPAAPGLFPSLQQQVRAAVEGQPTRRWSIDDVVDALLSADTHGGIRRDEVRNRLHNLSRSGHVSPLRRMPDGTFMANTAENRAIAEIEAKAEQQARRIEQQAHDSPAAACAEVVVDRKALTQQLRDDLRKRATRTQPPETIEHPERKALRDLIAAVITHLPDTPAPVRQAVEFGIHTLHRSAA
jgi:predicted DNA-binding transcriptional regulator